MATLDKLAEELERSHAELQDRMADPAVYSDHREAAELGRRLKELEPAVRAAREWRQASADLAQAKEDPELAAMTGELETEVERLEDELKLALVERDPNDAKDVIVEIRQGVGGDEASIWAGDVFRMLTRYAERRGFKWETLGSGPNDGSTQSLHPPTQPLRISSCLSCHGGAEFPGDAGFFPDILGGLLQRVCGARDQYEPDSFTGQSARYSPADSLAPSGDDCSST